MKSVTSISGGKTSGYLAIKYPTDYNVFSLVCINDVNSKPKDDSIIKYVNDKLNGFANEFGEFIATAEDNKTLIAMRDLEQLLGTNIEWVRGMSFDSVIDEGSKTRLPSWARRYCTNQMKILPIFLWWYKNIGVKCKMQIGFRQDEYDRMERFFNNSDPTNYSIPINCSLHGQKRQKHETYNWRYCHFPLIKYGITKSVIDEYWKTNGYLGGNLFEDRRQIEFPIVSNCIGCFHKSEEILASMSEIHPDKFKWFIDQENKGMGTWLDNKMTYQHLMNNSKELSKEVLFEIKELKEACDSEGCLS